MENQGPTTGLTPHLAIADKRGAEAIAQRENDGLTVEANFLGIKELVLHEATFTPESRFGEIAVRFVADQTYVVRNKAGEIVEGSPREDVLAVLR